MRRLWIALTSVVALLACNPATNAKHCEGVADFQLTLSSPTHTFPADTAITVTFGGGSEETFRLSASNDPEVLFCEITPASVGNEGGAGGASSSDAGAGGSASANWHARGGATPTGGVSSSDPKAISTIQCEIWSGGPATVSIRAGSWHTTRDLKPDAERCSLSESVVLGEPDPKP
ncbi:MAG TPA: hypothetical protein VG937_01975 [Polyangiaceae bacterium]|nr:hypothetical protein [Polyangiaceae bacterium]